ncbi:unnamed protein product, partial [Soboliphyme baturini]|uniref:CRAL-TRIO domain-containing protein n=1 Tax=Soboliphyme baturini TaxID=241478 RepID=A0A183J682_9BILA
MESTMEAKISKLAESWSRSSRLDKLLVVIKTGKSFLTDLETLELGDVFSVLLILQKLAPKIKRCQREKFNVVLCFEASEAEAVKNWRDLSTVTYQQCDQLVSAVCRLNTFQSGKFIVVSEEPLVRLAAVFREKYAFQGLLPDDVAKYVDKVAMK